MGTTPSAQPSAAQSGSDLGLIHQTTHEVARTRSALDSLRTTIATRRATDITEMIRSETDHASAGLEAVSLFLDSAPSLRSLSEFRQQHEHALDCTRRLSNGLSERALELLAPSERTLISEQFRPLSLLAETLHTTLHQSRNELAAQVIRNQESDFIHTGLRSIEASILTDLDRELRAMSLLGETRKRLVAHFKEMYLRPCVTSIEQNPLTGQPDHAALAASREQLNRDERIDIGPGQMVLLGKNLGTPRILRAMNGAADRLAHEIDSLMASSIVRTEMDPHLGNLIQPTSRGLASGLRFSFDFSWAPDPRSESCTVSLDSPWGDRGKYRFTLRPRPGEEVVFRRDIASLLRDIEALPSTAAKDPLVQSIEYRLHRLGGLPTVEAAPVSTVEEFLRDLPPQRSETTSKDELRTAVLNTLRQRATLTPLRIGSEGAEYARFNRVGIEIDGTMTTIRFFREGYNGALFDSAPLLTVVTTDVVGARHAMQSVEAALRKSAGDLSSPAGRQALMGILAAESSPLIGKAPVFEVATMRNLTLADYRDLTVRLLPEGQITNLVMRNSTIAFSNRAEGRPGRAVISNVAADERSPIRLELDGVHLERVALTSAVIQCRNCTAEDLTIEQLSHESARIWADSRNRFANPRHNAISRSLADRLATLFGSEPTFSIISRRR